MELKRGGMAAVLCEVTALYGHATRLMGRIAARRTCFSAAAAASRQAMTLTCVPKLPCVASGRAGVGCGNACNRA